MSGPKWTFVQLDKPPQFRVSKIKEINNRKKMSPKLN